MFEHEIKIAELTVQRAAVLTELVRAPEAWSKDYDAMFKADDTDLTIADLGSQALIISAIRHNFPDDTFIGEESADLLREDERLRTRVWEYIEKTRLDDESEVFLGRPTSPDDMMDCVDLGGNGMGGSGRVWVLDPIDGTKAYIQAGQYAVCLCLIVDGKVSAGVLACPNLVLKPGVLVDDSTANPESSGYIISVIKSQGVRLRPLGKTILQAHVELPQLERPKTVSQLRSITSLQSSTSDFEKRQTVEAKLGITTQTGNVFSVQMAYVAIALGGYSLMLRIPKKETHRGRVWDHAPGQLIFEEMGGKVTDLRGSDIDFSLGRGCDNNWGNVAAPQELHEQVIERVKAVMQRGSA
ncbi:3',5'-bisphosphate nucleotidase [Tothia fuscella]|uniref:3',5'-bisphosphate nucleotidase n=1 Tax=Tothia fuscella TaxID=1048955 RepID=A0A9P4NXX1_9PEZI|nr:3',5'-bisphosphate nucleotidase [Tothia fuscella]